MSFQLTGRGIHLRDGHILVARSLTRSQDEQETALDLNERIGNNNGHFDVHGENFSLSAEDISIDPSDTSVILRAQLYTVDRELEWSEVNLAPLISNEDGVLVWR
ncbi:hypothetical protein BGZ73_005209 [Actinomortierella ambigua]|nr:hypothetical protein BGZ73_005209 [Actinomortierella ambigua]